MAHLWMDTTYNREGRFVTPEPLGPGGDPYPAMYGKPNKELLDKLVQQSARYFRDKHGIHRLRHQYKIY